ncbi:hypothetical protein HLB10_19060, partial [Cellulomonas fimi]
VVDPHDVLDLQRAAGNRAVAGLVQARSAPVVQRDPPTGTTADDPAVAQRAADERAVATAVEAALVAAARGEGDLDAALPDAVRAALPAHAADALDRAAATATEVAEVEEEVDVPPHGPVPYDIATTLTELETLHAGVAGVEGLAASAGLRLVVRAIARHTAQAVAEVLPGGASFAGLYVGQVRVDVSSAAAAVHDATALLRLELEGTVTEVVDLREAHLRATDEAARAQAGAALGEAARRALLLNDALATAAGTAGRTGTTALDTAVEARAADIARLRGLAATEDSTRGALDDRLSLLTTQDVTITHGETPDEPVLPFDQTSGTTILPEEALPETTDEAEVEMAAGLAARIADQRSELTRLRGAVVPGSPSYQVDEFVDVHRRWFSLYSAAQEQRDPTVQMVLELMGEPYRLMGADVGSATVAVEGGIARAYLMQLGVDLMASSLHGETSDLGARVDAVRPRRSESLTGSADDVEHEFGELFPTRAGASADRGGEVRSREDVLAERQRATAQAATDVAAVPAVLRPAQARRTGLVTGRGDVPLVGVRAAGAHEGWTYLTDVVAQPDGGVVAREQKTVPPEVAAFLLASAQQRATLARTHAPTVDGRPVGSAAMRSGGVEAATGTSADRMVRGETSPRTPRAVATLSAQLEAAREESGVRPGGRPVTSETVVTQLQGDLRTYLDAFFVERQSTEYRLAAIFALANTEHAIGAGIQRLLDPATLATMIAEAVKISAIVMTLQGLGPLGGIAARAYQAYLSAQGVSNVAALISVAAFCRNAADADSLNRARAWGYMSRNVVDDASELFENLVTSPVTAGLHALTTSRPASPRELADALAPMMSDPATRAAALAEVEAQITAQEALVGPDASSAELDGLRAFRDGLLGRSTPETALAAEADLPGAAAATDPGAAAVFLGERSRSAADRAALHAALPADLAGVTLVESTTLTGNAVHVRYGDDGGVRLEVGPRAEPEHVRRHAETVRQLRRYEGVMGLLRRLLSRVRQALTGHPAYGTAGFEANLEVQKLTAIRDDLEAQLRGVEARADRMTRDGVDAAREADSVRREIEAIQSQLDEHAARLDSYESGRGIVAAEDTTPAMIGARERARALRTRAEAAAPGVRGALERAAAAHGAELAGLQYELKSEDSLTRKIHDRAGQRGPATDARLDAEARKINDVLRYTVVVDMPRYAEVHTAVRTALEGAGHTFVREGNAWAEPERFGGSYRGINATFRTADGLDFEVQVHTRESLAMKEELHAMYEEVRDPATPAARVKELQDEMRRRWATVPVPEGVSTPPPATGGRRR